MLKKNVPFYCAVLTANAANTDITEFTQLNTWLDGYCVGGLEVNTGYQCGWCNPGEMPPDNCIQGYAGCSTFGYIANTGDMLRDKNGNIIAQTENDIQTRYKCTTTGWQKMQYDISSGSGDSSKCDRYSYYDSKLGICLLCPDTNVYTDAILAAESQVLARGDNYQFLLTGCNYWANSGQEFYDKTGAFIFTEDRVCFHDGLL